MAEAVKVKQMKMGKTSKIVLCVLAVVVGIGAVGLRAFWRWNYPYGHSHCCIDVMMFALQQYADEHGGRYPDGEASPEASLSLLCKGNYADAYTLSGMTVPPDVAKAILNAGGFLGPESCGWHYVEGLTKADDRRIGMLWCKQPLGHNGERTRDGGRQVLRVNWSPEWVSGKDWPAFLAEQERLMSQRSTRAVEGRPLLIGYILLPDGTVTNEFQGSYTMATVSRGTASSGGGTESGSCLDSSRLTWYHPEIAEGQIMFTLSFSNLISDAVTVEFRDNTAVPSNITFRMRKQQ